MFRYPFSVLTLCFGLLLVPVIPLLGEEVKETPDSEIDPASHELAGTSWQLVKIMYSNDETLIPDDRSKYTFAFGDDGRVSMRIDCNRGTGKWNAPGEGRLEFGVVATTKALCPPDSLHDNIIKDLEYFRSYVLKDGNLHLALFADGGIYEMEPFVPEADEPTEDPE